MPTLPVPMFAALVFGFLAVRILIVRDRPPAFALLLAMVALQGVILSFPVLSAVQPVTAAMLPPLAWVVFQTSAIRPFDPGRDVWHFAAPAFTAFVLAVAPALLDGVIPAVFAVYGLALLWRLRRGVDSLPRLSLASGERPGLIWRLIAAALLASAVGDIAIAAALAGGQGWLKPWIVVVLTLGNLLAIGLLSLSGALAGDPVDAEDPAEAERASPPPDVAAADAALLGRLDALMVRDRLFLDPDLTLARLARRLALPAKTVSAAVNRATGENVSRLINSYRIRHACDRLAAGDSVTAAMLASGFNTKSNFNREFLRLTGTAPRDWRPDARDARDGPPVVNLRKA